MDDDYGDEILERSGIRYHIFKKLPELPLYFAFQTREGGRGILQIMDYTDKPQGIKVLFKQIKQGSPPQTDVVRDNLKRSAIVKPSLNPVVVVLQYLAAAIAGDEEAVDKLFVAGGETHSEDMRELAAAQKITIGGAYASGVAALVFTTPIAADHDRHGPIVFRLHKKRSGCLIDDIDIETSEGARNQIEGFQSHPGVRRLNVDGSHTDEHGDEAERGHIIVQSLDPHPQILGWRSGGRTDKLVKKCMSDTLNEIGALYPFLAEWTKEGTYRYHMVADQTMSVSFDYEYNLAPISKTKSWGPRIADGHYSKLLIRIVPNDGRPTQLDITNVKDTIQWDGEAVTRGYNLTGTTVRAIVTVATDSVEMQRDFNEIIDKHLTLLLKTLRHTKRSPSGNVAAKVEGDPQGGVAMIGPYRSVVAGAFVALLNRDDPQAALKILDGLMPELEKWKAMFEDTPKQHTAKAVVQSIEMIHKALAEGETDQAKALMLGMIATKPEIQKQLKEEVKIEGDPQGGVAMMEGLKAVFGGAYLALMERDDPETALKIFDELMPKLQEWKAMFAGTPQQHTAEAAVGAVEMIHKALGEGDVDQAKALMEGLNRTGEKIEKQLKEAVEEGN